MIVRRKWFPLFGLGKGPTQSTSTLLNGSSKAGIGCRGPTGTIWFGLTINLACLTKFLHLHFQTWPNEIFQNAVICLIDARMASHTPCECQFKYLQTKWYWDHYLRHSWPGTFQQATWLPFSHQNATPLIVPHWNTGTFLFWTHVSMKGWQRNILLLRLPLRCPKVKSTQGFPQTHYHQLKCNPQHPQQLNSGSLNQLISTPRFRVFPGSTIRGPSSKSTVLGFSFFFSKTGHLRTMWPFMWQ